MLIMLDIHYGECFSSITTVLKLCSKLKRRYEHTFAQSRALHDLVMPDCSLKVREVTSTVDISIERINEILHHHLKMLNLSKR